MLALCQDFSVLLTKPAQRGVFGYGAVALSGCREKPGYVADTAAPGAAGACGSRASPSRSRDPH